METLSREAIMRMMGRNAGTGGSGGGGGVVDMAGYATQMWVEEGYLSKAFFNRLFTVHGQGNTTVQPNDPTTTIDSIEAMFGFWTEAYVSALGRGQSGGALVLNEPLSGINQAGLGAPSQSNVAIVWNGSAWVYGATSGGSTSWNNITNKPTTISGYGITDAYISNGTIVLGSGSITPLTSHQSLAGYATESWVQNQGYATQTWVGNNYISVAFFNRLFKAYNGSTQVNANDTTSTIDSIKAMFGFWTEAYVSALGQGQSGGSLVLNQPLSGINSAGLGTPSQANVAIVWNGSAWTYGTTGSGSTAWSNITNKPTTISGYGITDAYISNGTIVLGSGSITPITSHQSLAGYATQSWVQQQGYITSSSLSGYATTTWVGNNYLALTGGTITGDLRLQRPDENYGRAIKFGDSGANDYAYIQENSDDHLLIYGRSGITVQSGGVGGYSGAAKLESLANMNDFGIELACSVDSMLRIATPGTYYGLVEISGARGTTIYTSNENCVIEMKDWSNTTGNNPGMSIRSKKGNITINPATGNCEVYNFVNRSDARNKNITEYKEYDVDDFARAPLFSFTWKQSNDQREHIGTTAQYWQPLIPETVSDVLEYDKDGKIITGHHLSLDYITLSFAGVVTLAREVVRLREELENLKHSYNN